MSQIPKRKHTKDEIAELRAKKAMEMAGQPVVNPYDKKVAKTPVIILGYLCALSAPLYLILLKFKNKFSYEMLDLKIMASGIILASIVAIFIFFARSLSRHHSSFIIIIALISSFSMVYLVNKDSMLQRELMAMLGNDKVPEKSEAERIVEEGIKRETSSRGSEAPEELVKPKKEKIILTPEEKAEMKRMFAPSEELRARELEAQKALQKREDSSKENSQ